MILTLSHPMRRFTLGAALLATLGLTTGRALAQPDDHGEEGAPAGMPPMGRPSEMDQIAFMQGKWDVEMKFRPGPEADWQVSQAQAESKLILDGCAQRMDFRGQIMGMPFHGIDHSTYNRETKRFESVWIDNMGARMSTMYGNFNADGALVMMGESMENGMKMKTRTVSTRVDEDTVTWSMEMSMDGENWFRSMEMTYSRVK